MNVNCMKLRKAERLLCHPDRKVQCERFNRTRNNINIICLDFLLAISQQELYHSSGEHRIGWINNQNRLYSVYLCVRQQLQQAAESAYQHTKTSLLAPGNSGLQEKTPYGASQNSGAWDSVVYVIVKNMDEEMVYKISTRDGAGPENNRRRLELRMLPTAITSMPITQT